MATTERTLEDVHVALSHPFPIDAVEVQPGALTEDKQRGLALAYVDPRAYMERLDAVVGSGTWSVSYRTSLTGVICRLTILGVTREDVGDFPADPDDPNKMTFAAMQAYKRACAAFGLGRHLYSLPQPWFNYHPDKKAFADPTGVVRTIYEMAGYVTTGGTMSSGICSSASQHPTAPAAHDRANGAGQTQRAAHVPPDPKRLHTARAALKQAEAKTNQPRVDSRAPTPAPNVATDPQLGLIARLIIEMQHGDKEEALAAAEAIDAIGDAFKIDDLSAFTSKDKLRALGLSKSRAHQLIEKLKALQADVAAMVA